MYSIGGGFSGATEEHLIIATVRLIHKGVACAGKTGQRERKPAVRELEMHGAGDDLREIPCINKRSEQKYRTDEACDIRRYKSTLQHDIRDYKGNVLLISKSLSPCCISQLVTASVRVDGLPQPHAAKYAIANQALESVYAQSHLRGRRRKRQRKRLKVEPRFTFGGVVRESTSFP